MPRDIKNILANGEEDQLVEGMSLVDYLSGPEMSGSSLNEPSLKHVRSHYETVPPVVTDPMRKGSATDALLFDYLVPAKREGRHLFDAVTDFDSDWPVFGGKQRHGKEWQDFQDEYGEQYLRNDEERAEIIAMLKAVAEDPVAARYWEEGVAQAVTRCTEEGLLFKGRPDWVCQSSIVDLKTTARIEGRALSNTTFRLGYQTKAALYRRWWKRLTGEEKPCVLIFVESKPPFDVVVVTLDQATLMLAEERALATIKQLREAIDTDTWPGVAKGEEMPLEVPPWEMEELEWQE